MQYVEKTIDVIILAGGFGTRIQSVSKNVPKSLLPVGNRFFLDYVLEWLSKYRIKRVVLSLHYKCEEFLSYLEQHQFPFEVVPIIEPEPMGTGGAVKYVIDRIRLSEPFGVTNGDSYLDFDISGMYKDFISKKSSAMIGLSFTDDAYRYGTVSYDDSTMLALSFREKLNSQSGWINNGFYLFGNRAFNSFDSKFSIEKDFFPELILQEELFVYPTKGEFLDIGVPEEYKKFIKKCSR